MEKITFSLWGLTLMEPLSWLMNWVLATQCLVYYVKLRKSANLFGRNWSLFFLMFAFSFLFGGASHLFYHYLGLHGKIPGWFCAVAAVAAGEFATISVLEDGRKKQMLTTVIRSKLFATLVLLLIDLSFKWVMVGTAGFWIIIGSISVQNWRAGHREYRYFLLGIVFIFLMAVPKIAQLDIHPAWFTRDDIAHVIMLGTYWMYYRGVRQISQKLG